MNTRTRIIPLFTRTLMGALLLLGGKYAALAQVKIGSNPTVISPSAVLEVESTSKGLLIPRMTLIQRNAIANPADGLLVLITDNNCITQYVASTGSWKGLNCDAQAPSAIYTVNCGSTSVQGNYATGVELVASDNTITLSVDVTQVGTYGVTTTVNGMTFVGSGTFTSTGTQNLVMKGYGFPTVVGPTFFSVLVGSSVCTGVINVTSGIATISACGTVGSTFGNVGTLTVGTVANTQDVVVAVNGITYTGGTVYGITTSASNGAQIYSPLTGNLGASPASLNLNVTGTPLIPGNTTLTYGINSQSGCSITLPVLSGTGRASATTCSGTLAGSYAAGVAMTVGNTKVVNLTVATAGTFTVVTNTLNGVYFTGTATLAAGSQNLTLTAVGTPVSAGPFSYTYNVSSGASTFVTCSFSVTYSLPSTVPNFTSSTCPTFGNAFTYIKSPNPDTYDHFGGDAYDPTGAYNYPREAAKISADGLTLVVGAFGEDGSGAGINPAFNNSLGDAGAAYIYTRASVSSAWTYQAYLKPSNPDGSDYFGTSVAISDDGNTVVVGSPYEDGSGVGVNPGANNSLTDVGAAYVYTRSGSTWSQQAYLKPNACNIYSHMGQAVAISGDGNTVALGAPYHDGINAGINPAFDQSSSDAGATYVYTRSGSTWSFQAYIKASNPTGNDYFGFSLSLSTDGNTLAVSAMAEDGSGTGINPVDNNSAADAGAAYVFSRTGAVWSQQAYIKASNAQGSDYFGRSLYVSGDGNTLVVGAPYEDGSASGINQPSSEGAANSGAAYVFKRTGSTWAQTAYVKASNTGADDRFGWNVALSKDSKTIVVGAVLEDGNVGCVNSSDNNTGSNVGAAYVYYFDGSSWVFSTKLKSSSPDNDDYFGQAVSVNADGKSIAIAAPLEGGSGTGVNPAQNNLLGRTGAIWVFTAP